MVTRILNPTRFTGWHMVGVLGLFFGVTIMVNIALAVFANGSWTGLIVKNSYVASQHYNERLVNDERQASLGWTGTFVYDNATVSLRITDSAGRPVAVDAVSVTLRRPASEQDNSGLTILWPLACGQRMSRSKAPASRSGSNDTVLR